MQKDEPSLTINAPNGSQDMPFQSQEFEQDGYRHLSVFDIAICRFLASFSLRYDVTDPIQQDNERLKV